MEILNKKQKIILIIIVSFALLFIFYYIINRFNSSKYIDIDIEQENINTDDIVEGQNLITNTSYEEKDSISTKIVIHIIGEVKNQGIVEIDRGSRIVDVIKEAGGTTKNADLSKINLAYIVEDGQKIYVPSIKDKDSDVISNNAGENVIVQNNREEHNISSKKVNINTASQTELETLNGIGTSTALKIVNYREQNGLFKKIEDIKNVPGIGSSKYENIRNDITVK